ncbi:MAG: LysR family transcriptional regulator [Alphaproteobacteria bacterium]|nr:LysR family transcriptional regulator [Alphaproteobacteria bacterium]
MINESAITLKQLRALVAINENGSLTAAAEMLGLTPPAVSTQLKLLEENLGTRLVMRGNDGKTSLTSPGSEVLRSTKQIEASLTSCYDRVKSIRQGKIGHLSIGVVSTGKYFAPHLVSAFQAQNPDIQVGLRIGNREDIIALVMDGAVDVAIMGRPPRAPVATAEILGPHPHIFIAPKGHKLATGCDVSPNDLLEETFLVRERGSGTRILMERLLDRLGEGRGYRTVSMGTNETIKQAVIAGLGIALISGHTVASELKDGRLVQIKAPGVPIIRQWFLMHRRDMPLTAVTEKFRRFIVDQKGSYLPRIEE